MIKFEKAVSNINNSLVFFYVFFISNFYTLQHMNEKHQLLFRYIKNKVKRNKLT